jgi:hypothetical protein
MTGTMLERGPTVPPPPRRPYSSAPEPTQPEASFHASLQECANNDATQPSVNQRLVKQRPVNQPAGAWSVSFPSKSSKSGPSRSRASARVPQQRFGGILTRAWSWLHAKYTSTTSKRLVLSETVSLGEKRFVALVSVEGREFLIGGSGSNVSLLAKLKTTQESENEWRQNAGVEEIAK